MSLWLLISMMALKISPPYLTLDIPQDTVYMVFGKVTETKDEPVLLSETELISLKMQLEIIWLTMPVNMES